MQVAILDDYTDTLRTLDCFDLLRGHDVTVWTDHVQDVDVLAERLADAEALVLIRERTAVTDELLARLPRLRMISQGGPYPHIDVDACTRHGVVLSARAGSGGQPSYATAELTWGLILAAVRRIPQQMSALRAGRWQESVGRTLRGRTLGIYGYGRIGRAVAGYGAAFGMDVLVWASADGRRRAAGEGVAVARDRRAFFAGCDVVSVHLRLVAETRGIVTADDLAAMRQDAVFVNTSRAGLVAPGALVAALEAGRPGSAAVDVFDREPLLDPADPLLTRDDVIATPHIGYVTAEDYEIQFGPVFEQVVAFAAGEPANVVNPAALRGPASADRGRA